MHDGRRLGAVIALAAAAMLTAAQASAQPSLPPPAAPGPAPQPPPPTDKLLVADVRIIGNETSTQQSIQSQLKTRKDREFDPQVVQADVRRLASTGRFHHIRPYTQMTPAGMVVTYEVFERPTIRYIRYLGNRGFSDAQLAKQDGINVGEPLNRYAVEEARRKIEEFYRSKGFVDAQVSIQEGDQAQDRGVVFAISEGQLQRISSVHFVGNTIASGERLKTQVKSKPGILWYLFRGKVDLKLLDEDIERLTVYYRGLGYFNARISRELEFGESGKWARLTFVIDEGPRYVIHNVSLVGNQKFGQEALLARLELKSGDHFNLAKLNRDVNTLRDVYGGQGHIFADIKAGPRFLEEVGQLDLVYNIQEGGVWQAGQVNVHIKGEHPHTRESVVRDRVSVRPGDTLNTRELRQSERRLRASQLFATDPAKGEAPRVLVRPPELQESVGTIANSGGTGRPAYRGQSPDHD
jgi:outer membrane protein insertion porin family